MKYPSEFPQDARARVETETLRAYAALEQEVRGIESWRRDVPFIRCIMRVFVAFAREACEFGKKSHHWAWSDNELDQRCRDFLLMIVIDAWENKARDLVIRKMGSEQESVRPPGFIGFPGFWAEGLTRFHSPGSESWPMFTDLSARSA